MFRAGHANRQRETDLGADASSDGSRYVGWLSVEADGAGDVEERFVDRDPFDSRGEVVEDGHHIVAKPLVAVEVATDEKEITAKLTGPPTGHASVDAVAPRFIRGSQHHASSHGDRPVPQSRDPRVVPRTRRRHRDRHAGSSPVWVAVVPHLATIIEHMFAFQR